MTLRTVTSPYDLQTLGEIRDQLGTYLGTAWANIPTAAQTVYGRIIDASADYLSKRFGHEPWCTAEESLSLAADVAILSLSAKTRHVITIIETYDSKTRVVTPTTKREWRLAWGRGGASSHPWDDQTVPHWFFDGMTDDNPPRQQWKRAPTPDKAITGTADVRPYFTLVGTTGDTQYTHLPATAATALMDYVFEKVEKFGRNWDAMAAHKASFEDELAATEMSDNPEGGIEAGRLVEPPESFNMEMGGP